MTKNGISRNGEMNETKKTIKIDMIPNDKRCVLCKDHLAISYVYSIRVKF